MHDGDVEAGLIIHEGQLTYADEGLRLLRLARGENQRPLVPLDAPAVYTETIELEHPLELLEPLLFLLARLRDEAHRFAITYHRQLRQRGHIAAPTSAEPEVRPRDHRRQAEPLAHPIHELRRVFTKGK